MPTGLKRAAPFLFLVASWVVALLVASPYELAGASVATTFRNAAVSPGNHTTSREHRTTPVSEVSGSQQSAVNGDVSSLLEAAIQAYSKGLSRNDLPVSRTDFQRASASFLEAVEKLGPKANADLYRNLGHAALQAGNRGMAIWSYRQCLRQRPQDRVARTNLNSLRAEIPAWARSTESDGESAFLFDLSATRIIQAFLVSGPLSLFFISLFVFLRRTTFLYLASGCLALATACWWLQTQPDWTDRRREGVVVGLETRLRMADSPRSPVVTAEPIPAGTEIQVLDRRNDWMLVQLPKGETGWALMSDVRLLAESPIQSPRGSPG